MIKINKEIIILFAIFFLFFISINQPSFLLLTPFIQVPIFVSSAIYALLLFTKKTNKLGNLTVAVVSYYLLIFLVLLLVFLFTQRFFLMIPYIVANIILALPMLTSLTVLVLLIVLHFSLFKICQSEKERKIPKGKSISGSVLLFLAIMGINYMFLQMGTIGKLAVGGYAQCAWLKNIPLDWTCEDKWQGSERHLIAFNPWKPSQFVEMQITGKERSLPTSCINILPIPLIAQPSIVGLGTTFICLSKNGFNYQTDWEQDGTIFRLAGQNLSLNQYLSILNSDWGPWYAQIWFLTYHPTIKVTPSLRQVGQTPSIVYELSGSNLCQKNTRELNEEVNVIIMDDKEEYKSKATVKSIKQCVLEAVIPILSLSSKTYPVAIEINNLRQLLRQ